MDANFKNVLYDALSSTPRMQSEAPWRLVLHTSAGGAYAAGFDRITEELIVVSDNGQGIFDASTGSQIYRNHEKSGYDQALLEATRLDETDHRPIPMAGEFGGGLSRTTSDGWSIDTLQIKWPTAFSILHQPNASIFFIAPQWDGRGKDASFRVVMKSEGMPVAFGFSLSGKSLIWLDRSDLFIWHRDCLTSAPTGQI